MRPGPSAGEHTVFLVALATATTAVTAVRALRTLCYAFTARKRPRACPALRLVSALPAERIHVGVIRELRTSVRGALAHPWCRCPVGIR
jgi:hypothetical protein